MNQASPRKPLDAAYDNRTAVPDWPSHLERWQRGSEALYASQRVIRDLRYGPRQRQRLDLFLTAEPGRPVVSYLHGGYWQWNDKEGQACAAAGLVASGFNVAIVEYTLCPAVGIADIVEEVWSSLDWLTRHAAAHGVDGTRIVATGISAGAHLAATQLSHPSVKAALLMSGIYDLQPIRDTWLNDTIGMDTETARRHSPVLHIPAAPGPVIFAAGAMELPALRQQTAAYHAAWIGHGHRGHKIDVPNADHFSIFDQFIASNGVLCTALGALAREAGLA